MAHHALPHLEIANCGGIGQLLESIPTRLKGSDINALGVLVDADTDIAARWRTIHDHLMRAGYPSIPGSPSPEGTIVDPPAGTILPKVGVWLMPDNRTHGILEDFVEFLVPAPRPLFECVRRCIERIPTGLRRFPDHAKPKAILHAWLALQEEPGKPMGTAITARYLKADVPQADAFVGWLKTLFFP